MTQTSRILCAVDLSQPAQAAFRYALALTRARGGELTMVHAIPSEPATPGVAEERFTMIAECSAAAASAGVPFRVAISKGDPVAAILEQATDRASDLIVTGTHQRTGLDRLRVGSVAEAITQAASCPVLIVPTKAGAGADRPPPSFQNVVCAVDFGAPSGTAYQHALALAGASGSRLTLVHVVPGAEFHSLAILDAWRTLQAAIPADSKGSGQFQVRVVTGDPAAQIVRVGGESNADVIVVGVTSKSAVSRRLFGATAARVMRTAGSPVLAVPETARQPVRARTKPRQLVAVA